MRRSVALVGMTLKGGKILIEEGFGSVVPAFMGARRGLAIYRLKSGSFRCAAVLDRPMQLTWAARICIVMQQGEAYFQNNGANASRD